MTSERIYVLFIYNLFIIFFSNHTRRIISLGWRNGFIHDDWFWSLMQSNDEGSLMKSPMTTAQHSTLMATVNLCASTLLCFQKHGGFFCLLFQYIFLLPVRLSRWMLRSCLVLPVLPPQNKSKPNSPIRFALALLAYPLNRFRWLRHHHFTPNFGRW